MPSKDVLAVSASHQGLTFKEETPFSVDKHTLTLTEKNGRETVYTRVKE